MHRRFRALRGELALGFVDQNRESDTTGNDARDTSWYWSEFIRRNNDELDATWGNLIHRVTTFAHRQGSEPKGAVTWPCDGCVHA